jgi:RHS repeat-associated protein
VVPSRRLDAWHRRLRGTSVAREALGGPAPYWTDYPFDLAGNRATDVQHTEAGATTRTYTYPTAGSAQPHAVSSIPETASDGAVMTSSYAYDAVGSTTTRAVAGEAEQTLAGDAEGKLTGVTQAGPMSSYVYTADGERLVRKQPGTTTVYLPGGQDLTLTNATSTVTAMRYYSFHGQTVAVRTDKTGASVSSLVNDPHGTAELSIANGTGVVSKRRMDASGLARGEAPDSWVGDHGFLNKPKDETGLVSLGARYYEPAAGRFVSVDPVMLLGTPQQWAAYSYADNNPVTYSDPSGLAPLLDGRWGSPAAMRAAKKAAGSKFAAAFTGGRSRRS